MNLSELMQTKNNRQGASGQDKQTLENMLALYTHQWNTANGGQVHQREKYARDQEEPEKPEVVFLGLPGDRPDQEAE